MPDDHVQCEHCGYWDHPGEHTWGDCASNLRAVNRDLVRVRDEYKVRATIAEQAVADVQRIVADA